MRDFAPPVLFVAVSVAAAAAAHREMRRDLSAGLLPLVLAGLTALWAIVVTALTTLPILGEYPSRGEAWFARSLVAIACGSWLIAAMVRPTATPTSRLVATCLTILTLAVGTSIIGGY